jgi:hypothetical protein
MLEDVRNTTFRMFSFKNNDGIHGNDLIMKLILLVVFFIQAI